MAERVKQHVPEEITKLLQQHLNVDNIILSPVSGGKNNQSFNAKAGDEKYYVKRFYRDSADAKSRYKRESDFYTLLNNSAIKSTPKMLSNIEQEYLCVYEYIDGKSVNDVTADKVVEAASFIRDINHPDIQKRAEKLLDARGSYFSGSALAKDIEGRARQLESISATTENIKSMQKFLATRFKPLLEKCNEELAKKEAGFTPFTRVLSPSDFGFHNVVEAEKLYFVDFEYAGWDSAEKLVCDFFSQPRYKLNELHLEPFIRTAFSRYNTHQIHFHCKNLMALNRLKWVLIFLNEFNHRDKERREFAAISTLQENAMSKQLEKAQEALREIEK